MQALQQYQQLQAKKETGYCTWGFLKAEPDTSSETYGLLKTQGGSLKQCGSYWLFTSDVEDESCTVR